MDLEKWELLLKERLFDYGLDIDAPVFNSRKKLPHTNGAILSFVSTAACIVCIVLYSIFHRQPLNKSINLAINEPQLQFVNEIIHKPQAIRPYRTDFQPVKKDTTETFYSEQENTVEVILQQEQTNPSFTTTEKKVNNHSESFRSNTIESELNSRSFSLQLYGDPAVFASTKERRYSETATGVSSVDTLINLFRPARIGVSLRKDIIRNVALTAGLFYHFDLAKATIINKDDTYSTTSYSQHFSGLSLKADYIFIKNSNLDLYATTGMDIMIRFRGTEFISGTGISNKLIGNPLAISITTSIGASYFIASNTAIFLEPGVSYRLFDNNPIYHSYNYPHTSIILNIGLRMNVFN